MIRAHTSRPDQVFMATLDYSSAQRQEEIGSRLIGGRRNSGWVWNLYDVSVKTGSGRVMASGTPFTLHWVVDAAGENIVRSDWNPTSQEFTVYVKAGLNWRRIHRTASKNRRSSSGSDSRSTADSLATKVSWLRSRSLVTKCTLSAGSPCWSGPGPQPARPPAWAPVDSMSRLYLS